MLASLRLAKWAALALTTMTASAALALPMPKPGSQLRIPKSLTPNYNFVGIVALDDCSGSLIRFENSKPTDHALVMTNGHCVESGFQDPNTFISHRASDRAFRVLDAKAQPLGDVFAKEIVYSTMTKTDVTVYRLDETFDAIKTRFSVEPLTLSSAHPQTGQAIEVISGYWKRGYSCQIEAFVPGMKESDWQWMDSIRYTRPGCEVIGGTSGSPIVLAGTRTVIGINNTTNEDGDSCTLDNPCEIDGSGKVSANRGYSYGQETYWIYSCLNAQNEIDLAKPGCELFH